ncbi:lipoprotein N-acyltransferase Lnb domain-containing protein [Breznakiellaceae bacterium SP9]
MYKTILSRRILICLLFLLLGLCALCADENGAEGERYVFQIAVIGPGDELYFWWGHIALVITDTQLRTSSFYDWGLFSFENDNFFFNFAMGRLLYRCGVSPTHLNLRNVIEHNRDVTLYTLNLPPAAMEEIRLFAEWNVLPENQDYYYHHFKDNCATRIRDILDMATDGAFKKEFGEKPGRFTLREHVRRHTWHSPFFDWLLNFLMGQDIDTPITVWQEMFLPSEIAARIADFTYTDPAGLTRKLVSRVEVINRSIDRPIVLERPRTQWPYELGLGLFIAAVMVVIKLLSTRRTASKKIAARCRKIYYLLQALLGLFLGSSGVLLFFMMFFTNHDYCYYNSNILYLNPLTLAIFPLSLILLRKENPHKQLQKEFILKSLWTLMVLGAILSRLITAAADFYQQNQVTVALVLPFAVGLSFLPDWITLIIKIKKVKK